MKTQFGVGSVRAIQGVLFAIAVLLSCAGTAQAQISPAAGYWWNPNQGGNGFVIEVQGNTMFMAGFLYATNGEATWVASSGPMTSSSQYSGSLITYNGGETLTGTYKPATLTQPALGNISINFTSNTQATITWPGGTDNIQRFDFGPGGSGGTQPATNPQTGWWWNPNEGGRGFAIEVQGGSMYLAGYMYDTSGNPVWYLASGNMANGLFQGQWSQYQGGITLTGAYKAPTVANSSVGAVTLQFSSTSTATLTLPGGRQIPLDRFNFGVSNGPTLSSFSPSAGAPASVITVAGSNINPNATLSLTFSNNSGFSVSVPPTSATANSITASVPPYFNTSTGAFGTGTVSVSLSQSSGGATTNSNSLSGFTIQALPAAGKSGQNTLALIQANLQEAQKLQTSIKGTPQETPTLDAAITTQITDMQTLVTNIQNVVANGQSFSLGAVGGVNITVTPSNISDVDSLILATLQSLTTPPGGEEKSAEEATTPACMSAQATAYANGVLAGDSYSTLLPLAIALLEAPNTSACASVAGFTSAYQIFGGAGNIGIGIADAAGLAVDLSKLPGAALFATANGNANTSIGINALLATALAAEAAEVQAAISGVTVLSQPATAELVAEATGFLETAIADAQTVIITVAPVTSSSVATNLPTGNWSVSFTYSYDIPADGISSSGSGGPIAETAVGGATFATYLQNNFTAFQNSLCSANGVTCNGGLQVTPFDGHSFQIIWNFSSGGATYNITYTITYNG